MLPDSYIDYFGRFINEEISLIGLHGEGRFQKSIHYYNQMYQYLSMHLDDYIYFKESGADFYKFEFSERVEKIRNKLILKANRIGIPEEAIFIPRIKVFEDSKWLSIIHKEIVPLINDIYENDSDDEFNTLRLFNIEERNGELVKWSKSKNGRNFLYEFQVSKGVRPEALIKNRLYLFDKIFIHTQMLYMSDKLWVHNVVCDAFNKWKADKTLWNNIDHLKRRLVTKEQLDESRKEIIFRRLLEKSGFQGRFIHDEIISWHLKYRPDFWFVNEDLIVEYDEIAHKFQEEEDRRREKIISKYLPNVKFIRVKEGFEEQGLIEIQMFLNKMEKYEMKNKNSG
jgi:hypothetical protein